MSDSRNEVVTNYDKEPVLQAQMEEVIKAEGIDVKEETPIVPEISEIEKEARSLGWQSKEEREAAGKNNKYFVSPEEYVSRRPLFERIENQTKQIQELRDLQKQQQDYLAKVRKESYEQALKDLEAKREFAVKEADADSFRAYDHQHQELQKKMYEDQMIRQAAQPQVSPDVHNFVTRNQSWYNANTPENQKMKVAAETYDNYLIAQHRANGTQPDVNQHLSAIESEVKRLFPHRFADLNVDRPVPVQAITKSTAPIKTVQNKDLVSQLTKEQLEIANYLKPNDKEFLEMYAHELKKSGKLGK